MTPSLRLGNLTSCKCMSTAVERFHVVWILSSVVSTNQLVCFVLHLCLFLCLCLCFAHFPLFSDHRGSCGPISSMPCAIPVHMLLFDHFEEQSQRSLTSPAKQTFNSSIERHVAALCQDPPQSTESNLDTFSSMLNIAVSTMHECMSWTKKKQINEFLSPTWVDTLLATNSSRSHSRSSVICSFSPPSSRYHQEVCLRQCQEPFYLQSHQRHCRCSRDSICSCICRRRRKVSPSARQSQTNWVSICLGLFRPAIGGL